MNESGKSNRDIAVRIVPQGKREVEDTSDFASGDNSHDDYRDVVAPDPAGNNLQKHALEEDDSLSEAHLGLPHACAHVRTEEESGDQERQPIIESLELEPIDLELEIEEEAVAEQPPQQAGSGIKLKHKVFAILAGTFLAGGGITAWHLTTVVSKEDPYKQPVSTVIPLPAQVAGLQKPMAQPVVSVAVQQQLSSNTQKVSMPQPPAPAALPHPKIASVPTAPVSPVTAVAAKGTRPAVEAAKPSTGTAEPAPVAIKKRWKKKRGAADSSGTVNTSLDASADVIDVLEKARRMK